MSRNKLADRISGVVDLIGVSAVEEGDLIVLAGSEPDSITLWASPTITRTQNGIFITVYSIRNSVFTTGSSYNRKLTGLNVDSSRRVSGMVHILDRKIVERAYRKEMKKSASQRSTAMNLSEMRDTRAKVGLRLLHSTISGDRARASKRDVGEEAIFLTSDGAALATVKSTTSIGNRVSFEGEGIECGNSGVYLFDHKAIQIDPLWKRFLRAIRMSFVEDD